MTSDPRRSCTPSAFTLIELLVTIAILSVLAGILVPVIGRAKYSAKDALCRNNLRQISLSLATYVSTYEAYPICWNYSPDFSYCEAWDTRLDLPRVYESFSSGLNSPGYRLSGVFRCPFLSSILVPIEPQKEGAYVLFSSYGYNAYGVGHPNRIRSVNSGLGLSSPIYEAVDRGDYLRHAAESEVKAPANMIAMGDVFCRSQNPNYDASICTDPVITPFGNYLGAAYPFRPHKTQPAFLAHRSRCNRAFVDGHLESEDMRKNFEARDDQLAHWNIDNLPHRDAYVF